MYLMGAYILEGCGCFSGSELGVPIDWPCTMHRSTDVQNLDTFTTNEQTVDVNADMVEECFRMNGWNEQ